MITNLGILGQAIKPSPDTAAFKLCVRGIGHIFGQDAIFNIRANLSTAYQHVLVLIGVYGQ